jgi:bla regulator protein BlaR1
MGVLMAGPRPQMTLGGRSALLVAAFGIGVPMLLGQAKATRAEAGVPKPQSSPVPEWQTAAGGKMQFAVASVRLDKSGVFKPPSIPLGADDSMGINSPSSGGLFTADFHVGDYISFAFKLDSDQRKQMFASLPDWATTENFEVQARSEVARPTKDQLRLMMQSLLADRFQLAAHTQTRQLQVLAMILVKPGKTGPGLVPHADGPPCDLPSSAPDDAKASPPAAWPPSCGTYMAHMMPNGMFEVGSRNTTMDLLASSLSSFGGFGRPMVDQTGLQGRFDFTLRWTPAPGSAFLPPGTVIPPQVNETTFSDALKNQLGIELKPSKTTMEVLVVDHIEQPSEN